MKLRHAKMVPIFGHLVELITVAGRCLYDRPFIITSQHKLYETILIRLAFKSEF